MLIYLPSEWMCAAYCPLPSGEAALYSLYRHCTVCLAQDAALKCYGCHFLFPFGHSVPQFSQISQQLLTLHWLLFCHLEKRHRPVFSFLFFLQFARATPAPFCINLTGLSYMARRVQLHPQDYTSVGLSLQNPCQVSETYFTAWKQCWPHI